MTAALVGADSRRMLADAREAVARYLATAQRSSLLRRSALYERPWFLALGPTRGGKTTLFAGSGLHVAQRYPCERDGLALSSRPAVQWHFADEAVWVDAPGALCDDASAGEWRALIAALQVVRRRKPIDGIALVLDVSTLLAVDQAAIKELARRLRRRMDEAIAAWSLEFPVYLVLTHADGLPGFRQFAARLGQGEVLGTTLSAQQQRLAPRQAFGEEFGLLRRCLADARMSGLLDEPDAGRQRLICRFALQFGALEPLLADLVTELFRSSGYTGTPLFRGFYFTACEPAGADQAATARPVGSTVADHPLNPRRAAQAQPAADPRAGALSCRCFSVLPLLRSVMPGDRSLTRSTRRASLRSLGLRIALALAIVTATAGLLWLMAVSYSRASATLSLVRRQATVLSMPAPSLQQRFQRLQALCLAVQRLQAGQRGFTQESLFGFSRSGRLLDKLEPVCYGQLQQLVVAPALAALEADLRAGAGVCTDLPGSGYEALYGTLKTYLSLTETAAQRLPDVDTTRIRPLLAAAATSALLQALGCQRLPADVESAVSGGLPLYLYGLKTGRAHLLQGDQQLIGSARARLRRLPDAPALCEAVTSRLGSAAPRLNLGALLRRSSAGLLASSASVRSIYLPAAWPAVSVAIAEASRNPYAADWVAGLPQRPPAEGVDSDSLRQAMTAAFAQEYRGEWLGMLASVKLRPLPGLEKSGPDLVKLAAPGGELETLLRAAADGLAVRGLAEGVAGAARAVSGSATVARSGPFAEVNALADTLVAFLRSSPGQTYSMEGYRGRLLALAAALDGLAGQGSDAAARTLRGGDDDPLLAGYRYTKSALGAMPAVLADSLAGLLLAPYEQVGAAAGKAVGTSLDGWWRLEVVKAFDSRCAGRYPFGPGGSAASYDDVMDFFRPVTGTFWGFFERVLAPYLAATPAGWQVRSPGPVRLSFDPQLGRTLAAAARIRDVFFRPTGEPRPLQLNVSLSGAGNQAAELEVDGQKIALAPGGRPQPIHWPGESAAPGASLRVQTGGGQSQELRFEGPWGLLRLVQQGSVSALNASTVVVSWQMNVQNVYLLKEQCRIEVSSDDHPFAGGLFEGFALPQRLTAVEQGNAPLAGLP